ncbi:cyclin-D-binding Myb-like transcription factor 1 [Babylonia areolata]|uniref:cyclin-D-binding Myb-like transcription factor 1 n=1 Tax=Babylonia areolata TaxID=304850 RepID=UPI003FD0E0A3
MDEDNAGTIISEGEITDGMHLEAVDNPEECVMAEVKTEVIDPESLQMAPQQYIIVAPQETGDGTTLEPASKFIRLEGEDGQSYLLAVTGDTSALTQTQIETGKENVTISAVELDTAKETSSLGRATASTSGTGSKRSSNPPSASDGVNQTWFTTRDDKHAYQKGGHSWKQGQWTKDEIEILQNNINQYCQEQSVSDPKEIIFDMSKDERKDFYRTIARGLQRPLFSVYRRVTRMYDQKNHRGKYSPEEIKKLRELRAKHGSDWAAIGTELGRSASSVKDKCRLMKDNCNAGKWYPEEERRLAQAIYDLTGLKPSDSITQGLSWSAVAEEVGTRSEKQCRTKWLNYLNWKQQGGADWTRQDDLSLVEKIHKLEVQNDQDIDWNELSKDWPSVRSPQWLRGKWWSLKRHVPNYQEMEFPVLVDHLLSLLYQNAKTKNGMRVSRMDMPGGASAGDMALHIPVSLQPAGIDDDVTGVEGGEDMDSFQAFEVLQQWTPNNSTAFFITQPPLSATATTAVSVGNTTTTTGLSADHIIVQAMPMAQSEGVKVENVQVQLNPQVIIRAGEHEGVTGLDTGLAIQLPEGLRSEQDLHLLTGDESIAGGTDDDELTSAAHIREQGIIDQESAFEVQVVSEAGLTGGVEMEAVVSGGDLVMGCGGVSSPPQFTQSSSNDTEIIDPLSDPILISNESDLMGSSSDLESEKVHHHGLGVGDDLH